VVVSDTLGRPVEAGLGELPGGVAVVELAQASGYELLSPAERDPEATSTRGTGELIRAALDLGARTIVVGLGGSATNDGGLGLARELGVRALDAAGRELEGRGADLRRVARIDLSGRDARLAEAVVRVACDVDTPFHGPDGAARVFGPQKGADPAMVERLERRLDELARTFPRDPRGEPMTGCAGGLSGGLWAACGATLVPGAAYVLDAIGFDALMRGSAFVVTGEGSLDEQTLEGKIVGEVATRCRQGGVTCHAIVGRNQLDPFGQRIIDLASVTEATTLAEMEAAAAALV
jgi:glycerate kinase